MVTAESWEYNIAAIRSLLLAAFTAEDLRRFCLDDPNFHIPASPSAPSELAPSLDPQPSVWKAFLSKPIVWVVIAALILSGGYWLLVKDAPPQVAKVAILTAHNRYVTAMGGDFGWELRADTGVILDCEKFVLLCQDVVQVALQTCHKTQEGRDKVVTATWVAGRATRPASM